MSATEEIHLDVDDIHKHYGGIKALSGATVMVKKNQLTSLIGPNGSGKTTLFNVITGWVFKTDPRDEEDVEPTDEDHQDGFFNRIIRSSLKELNMFRQSFLKELNKIKQRFEREAETDQKDDIGHVIFEDMRLDGLEAHEIGVIGLMRTFQTTRNWQKLTVLENLLVAPHNQTGDSFLNIFFKQKQIQEEERRNTLKALEILDFLEISQIRDQIASELSGGQLKLLAVGRLLMTVPRLLLLDEPMAGINPTLGNKIMDKIVELKKDATIFLIEHNMDVVFNYSDEIFVMARGQIIAQGTPDEIEKNKEVIEAYLGADY
ncbi:MAG: ABC transporter ATP-binding protein [Promethearchaeota archaeon]